jgi:Zn-dependent M16 (insulinase) family peptidase
LDTSFNNNIADILAHLPNCSIKRNTVDTIIGKIEFDLELEEKFPFTKCLYEDMLLLLQDSDILVDDIEHLQYKERYTFRRGQEMVILDFEYKLS